MKKELLNPEVNAALTELETSIASAASAVAAAETAIDALENLFQEYASADYGVAWASVALPETPVAGMMVLRNNTNGTEGARLYIYNGTAWMYVAVTAVS